MQATKPTHVEDEKRLSPSGSPRSWHTVTKVAFRFLFAYFVLYNFPLPLTYVPGTDKLFDTYAQMWHAIEAWVGQHVLHLSHPITVFAGKSGDTTSDYVQLLCFLALAFTAAVVWSILDRKRGEFSKLQQWLWIYLRIVLGSQLLFFSALNLMKAQFPQLFLSWLVEPYGESSPMRLLAAFFGYSTSYNIFIGAAGMLAGILLFVPRLATLGGLLSATIMTNGFMLTMSYDYPVKIYAFHLLAMSVLLVAPDLKRLADFLVFNRRVEAAVTTPLFSRVGLSRSLLAVQLLLCVIFVSTFLSSAYQDAKSYGVLAPKPPLYGIWSVEEFKVNGELRPPLLTDELRWQRVIFDQFPKFVAMQKMNGALEWYGLDLDLTRKSFALSKPTDPNWKSQFVLEQPQPELILLDGKMEGRQVQVKLRREPQGVLNTRGFHWVNEYPFNR